MEFSKNVLRALWHCHLWGTGTLEQRKQRRTGPRGVIADGQEEPALLLHTWPVGPPGRGTWSLRLPPALTDHLTSTKPGIELGDTMTRQDKVPDQGGESLEEHAGTSR